VAQRGLDRAGDDGERLVVAADRVEAVEGLEDPVLDGGGVAAGAADGGDEGLVLEQAVEQVHRRQLLLAGVGLAPADVERDVGVLVERPRRRRERRCRPVDQVAPGAAEGVEEACHGRRLPKTRRVREARERSAR
jgi:hypothetical protein